MFGTLRIKVAMAAQDRNKLVTVYTKGCTREDADAQVTQFKWANPELKLAIAMVSWHADPEYL